MGILVLAAKQESCSDSLLRPALQPLLLLRLIPSMDPMAMEDMAMDMVWAMLDMEDTMAPILPLLHTMPPMAMLPLGSMLLTLLVLSTLPRGLLMLMPTMEDMESTLDPRPLVFPPSPMLDSLCRDMPRDMAMDLDTMAKGLLMLV